MRDSKKYMIMALLLILGLIIKFANPVSRTEQVNTFRGADLRKDIWNPLIAESVNEKDISVLVNNKEVNSGNSKVFMNDDLTLMFPVSLLSASFNCSTHLYEENKLLIEKRANEISFVLDEPAVTVNKEKSEITSSMIYEDGEYYVPADTVSSLLNFSYEWNMEANQAAAVNNTAGEGILPTSYDLRKKQRTPVIKDQGQYGTCWAFAALSAMESALLPEEQLEFSPDHMSLQNSFYLEQKDGGNYPMGMAYLTAWQGPVYETEDPYGDNYSPDNLTPAKHVQEIQIIEGKDFENIKEAVFKYGGVQTSIYSAIRSTRLDSDYYNSSTDSYCYIGPEKANHDVLIIGWDDNYPKENFNLNLEGDGAFICQNSWGSEFGEEGVFYISYYDVLVGTHNLVYTGIEENTNYDNIYQSDLCGWVGKLGYNKESIYGANIYRAKGKETLRAAGFYAVGRDTEYKIYIVKDFTGTQDLSEGQLAAEGKLGNMGYYTIPFTQAVDLEPGETYGVVLHVSTPGEEKPLAIEYYADEFTSTVDISDGESYISSTGSNWESLEETQNSNLCLKVYSDNR